MLSVRYNPFPLIASPTPLHLPHVHLMRVISFPVFNFLISTSPFVLEGISALPALLTDSGSTIIICLYFHLISTTASYHLFNKKSCFIFQFHFQINICQSFIDGVKGFLMFGIILCTFHPPLAYPVAIDMSGVRYNQGQYINPSSVDGLYSFSFFGVQSDFCPV